MSNPRYDSVVASSSAATSFTTSFEVLNYNQCAVQIIWTSLNTAVGTVKLQASNDGTNWENLTALPYTMTSANDNHIFNMYEIGYAFMQVNYAAVSNTAGQVTVKTVRKSFS